MGEISLIEVSKRFTLRVAGETQAVQALSRVSFTVRDGEIVSLIGPSGCGKTTALRIAMGLETANGGRVTVDGREVTGCGHDRGMVFQHAELLPWLTAMQNVLLMDEPFGALDAQTRETIQGELMRLHERTRKTILFVTHDLDEAVLIADRIVIMRQGRIQEIMDVPLPRPRGDLVLVRATKAFADTRYRVWQALHADAPVLH